LLWQPTFGKKAKIALNYIITSVPCEVSSQFLFGKYRIGNIEFTCAD